MTDRLHEFKSLPATAAEARAVGSARYFTGRACKHGHVAPRYTASRGCSGCSLAATSAWQDRNPSKRKAYADSYNGDYYERNAESLREKNNAYNAANREKRAAAEKARRSRNAEKIRAKDRVRYASDPDGRKVHIKNWQRANPHKLAEFNAHRRAATVQATPPWLTKEHRREIAAKHAEAQRLSVETGNPHHVDHIFPLKGENFCGLHVPWNLQVMLGAENCRKQNKPPPHESVFA